MHDISIPWKEGDSFLDNEERIIFYVEKRLFLEPHDAMRYLTSVEDHFEYAVNSQIPKKNHMKGSK